MIIKCYRCGKDLDSPNIRNADYIIASDTIVNDTVDVLIATYEEDKPDPLNKDKAIVVTKEIRLERREDSENVPRLTHIREEKRIEPVQKTGIICPDCYRDTDFIIWGVHAGPSKD